MCDVNSIWETHWKQICWLKVSTFFLHFHIEYFFTYLSYFYCGRRRMTLRDTDPLDHGWIVIPVREFNPIGSKLYFTEIHGHNNATGYSITDK